MAGADRIKFHCPYCGVTLSTPREYAGTEGECKSCGRTFVAPTETPPQPALSEPSAEAVAHQEPRIAEAAPVTGRVASRQGRGLRRGVLAAGVVVVAAIAVAGWWFSSSREPDVASKGSQAAKPRAGKPRDAAGAVASKAEDLSIPVVVGVKESFCHSGLTAGTALTVVSLGPNPSPGSPPQQEREVEVRTASGAREWLPRHELCSQEELARRIKQKEVPAATISMCSDGTNSFFCNGAMSIENNGPVIEPGSALWFDPSMKGRTFDVCGTAITCDPTVLILVKAGGKISKLPVFSEGM